MKPRNVFLACALLCALFAAPAMAQLKQQPVQVAQVIVLNPGEVKEGRFLAIDPKSGATIVNKWKHADDFGKLAKVLAEADRIIMAAKGQLAIDIAWAEKFKAAKTTEEIMAVVEAWKVFMARDGKGAVVSLEVKGTGAGYGGSGFAVDEATRKFNEVSAYLNSPPEVKK